MLGVAIVPARCRTRRQILNFGVTTSGQVIYQGTAGSRAAYSRYQEIFANVRANYDAENRAADEVAGAIKTQIAAFLASSA